MKSEVKMQALDKRNYGTGTIRFGEGGGRSLRKTSTLSASNPICSLDVGCLLTCWTINTCHASDLRGWAAIRQGLVKGTLLHHKAFHLPHQELEEAAPCQTLQGPVAAGRETQTQGEKTGTENERSLAVKRKRQLNPLSVALAG